ncbi:glycine betaine--corrinoid protein methyltransferase [Desulfosporosinus sp. PR]|uniref:glycine betaine--corrinoid protein methyltransferase n=1 Tax=Candidatus Desulfosporosinus nitrosoreducens TaxID=3401928 RepID=UPI0027F86AC9|nr:glycine betaine--corrinoid protein methyltransferase [Desulfosporosinus sp. PR]MDQ7093301.1 glycine betaine--corrinoid protein methyltransferase [Desulfosporosinus sp. PR]
MLLKYNVLTQEQVTLIHDETMKILEEIGMEFEYEPALEVFKAQGQRVEGTRVYFKRDFIEAKVRLAPSQFTLHARNPEHNLVCGGENIIYMPGYGAPFIHEVDGTRRKTTMQDYDNFVKLAGASKNMHMTGGTVAEPQDIPDEIRHLKMLYSSITNSDKCFMGSAEGRERAEDSIEMAAILFGGKDVIKEKPVLISLINSLTPLKYDERMLGAMMAYAEAGQAVVIASLVMAGSTGPAALAGTLALQNAEVLAGIALAQSINPGTPVVYGSTSALSDMHSGSLSIGSPECALFISASAQLARFYEVPSRSGGGLNDSKIVDAQAGYESMMTLMAASVTGINFVLHTAGILQYFMAMSYEKFMMDDEMAGMLLHYLKGFNFDEDGMAFDVIAKVGPGGHFLTQKHTRKNHKREFRTPQLSDRTAFESWSKEKLDTNQRACKKWQEVLANYVPPVLDETINSQLLDFIAKRSE